MDSRAQEIIEQVALLAAEFGVPVTIKRKVLPPVTPAVRNAFGTRTNTTTETVTTNVIIELHNIDTLPTLVGNKAKEKLKMIAQAGLFLKLDELTYNGHDYQVEEISPVPFLGEDVVNFVTAFREVD